MEVKPGAELHGELEAEVPNDWVDFESVFKDYDRFPPLKIKGVVVDHATRRPLQKQT